MSVEERSVTKMVGPESGTTCMQKTQAQIFKT